MALESEQNNLGHVLIPICSTRSLTRRAEDEYFTDCFLNNPYLADCVSGIKCPPQQQADTTQNQHR